jgi:hypothetical protein
MADSGMGKILTLGALGVGAYFAYEWFVAPQQSGGLGTGPIPSDALYAGMVGCGVTITNSGFTGPGTAWWSPSTNKFYFSASRQPSDAEAAAAMSNIVAGHGPNPPLSSYPFTQVNCQGPSAGATPMPIPPSTGGGLAPLAIVPQATAAAAPSHSSQLDSIYAALKAAAASDPNFTGTGDALTSSPYRWNFYLQRVLPGATMDTPVSNTPDLNATFPGVDLSQNMTAAVYWAGMSNALGATQGVSGFLAGLGALVGARALKDAAIRKTLGLGDTAVYGPATPTDELTIGSVVPLSTGGYAQVGEGAATPALVASAAPLTLQSIPASLWLIGGGALFGLALLSGGRR